MQWYHGAIIVYLAVINIAAACVTIHDKKAAVSHRWRIPENTLLVVSALGVSPAMYLTMRCIHHKTRKAKFMVGIPVIFFLELTAVAAVWLWLSGIPLLNV